MFDLWQAFKNLGTPSTKRRKVSGAVGGATQGAKSRSQEASQPTLIVLQQPPLSQEAGNDGCTPEEAEPQPLYATSPSPGGTPSYAFKRFPQPKGLSFLERNTTMGAGQRKLSADLPPVAAPVAANAPQQRGKQQSGMTGSDLSLAFEGEVAALQEGGRQQSVAGLQARPEQIGGARATGLVELPMDWVLHLEPATRPRPEAAAAAAQSKPFFQRVKSILTSSAAVTELEQAAEEWDPMDVGPMAPKAPLEPAASSSKLDEAKAWEEQTKDEAQAACQRARAVDNSLVERLGSLKLSRGGATQQHAEALLLKLEQLDQLLSVLAAAKKPTPPALLQRALPPEAEDRAESPAQSITPISEGEASEALSAEDLQAAVEALSDEDFEHHLAALSQGYYDAYGEALDDAAAASRPKEILVLHRRSNIEIDRKHMACMKPLTWLNDEIINIYMALLIERDRRRREQGLGPKCHFFNSFFANKLYKDHGYAYQPASRWTRPKPLERTGQLSSSVLDLDLLLVPVHQGVHWVCAAIDLQRQEFVYYDSLGGEDRTCLEMLARWLKDEYKDKRGEVVDIEHWPRRFPKDIPQQHNGCDCGMFAILFADYASLRKPMQFGQQDIDYYRVKMVNNILRNEAD